MPPCKPHAVMVPLPETGHINPMMHLALYLSSAHGFRITFVNTLYNHTRIVSASAGRLPSEHGQDIRLVAIPDGVSESDNRDNDVAIFVKVIENIGPVLEELILKLNAEGPSVTCIISDVTARRTLDVAKTLGIPRVAFWPPNASIYAFICHAIHASAHGEFSATGIPEPDEVISFPGIPPVKGAQAPWVVGSREEVESIFLSTTQNTEALRQSEWILCNSVHELEATVQDLIPSGFPKVCPIGPLFLTSHLLGKNSSREERIGTSMWVEQAECLDWLDAQVPQSVMYFSVGTIALLSKEQLHEVAYGLEASGVAVLWVLRADVDRSLLPEGYMERNEWRIRIVEWCPQLLVLSHIAVGGFLTHCGWNSTIEAMSMGVPMLAWPQLVDQFINAQLVVRVWGVGLELASEEGQGLVSRKIVDSQVRKLMDSHEGLKLREKVSEVRLTILQASKEGGSSHTSLLQFVDWIKQKSEAIQKGSTC